MKKNSERVLIFVLGCTFSWAYFSMRYNSVVSPPIASLDKPADRRVLNSEQASNNITPKQNSAPSEYDVAKKLLQEGKYSEFMQLYANVRSLASESDNARYRHLILRQIHTLSSKNQKIEAYELVRSYLDLEYNDVDALMLLGRLHRAQKNYLAAIDTMYSAKSYAHNIDKINQLSNAIRSLVSEYKQLLNKQSNDLALLELYGRLTVLEPDYALNYIGLAQAHIALGNNEDARRALSLASLDPEVSYKANELLNIINQKPPLEIDHTSAVSLKRVGDQFAVEASLNNSVQVTLLLDTGASLSIISFDTLARLGLSPDQATKTGWFTTANGVVQAPIISLAGFTVGGHIVENIEVGVMDVSHTGSIDGLLGMNFLKHFKFYIDQNDNKMHLQLR